MGEYSILEHTADGAIEVITDGFEDLLSTSAEGMFSLMVDLKDIDKEIGEEFSVEGEDELELLLNFLKELLFISTTKFLYFKEFHIKVESESPFLIKCKAFGEEIDTEKHFIYGEVKMVTYHDIEFKKEGEQYRIKLLFDM